MDRGKDDEKIAGPMFPRLHVNDADKGGPRAPPRNKMALYEQLSIPSQRGNSASGVVPLNPNFSANMVPSASSSQASGVERNLVYPRHLPPSTPTHWSEKFQARHSDALLYGNAPEAQLEQREKVERNEDFIVPVFVQARVNQSHDRSQNSIDRETLASISSTRSGQPVEQQSISTKEPKHNNFTAVSKRQDVKSESNENMTTCGESARGCVISATDTSSRENTDGLLKEAKATSNQHRGVHVRSNLSRLHDGEACLHQDLRTNRRLDSARRGDDIVDSTRDIERENASQPRSESCCEEDNSGPKEPEIDSEYNSNSNSNRTCISSQIENVDKGDDLSETSMVDSISGVDISSDDVVGIIGQKHFWKARRAITMEMSRRPPRQRISSFFISSICFLDIFLSRFGSAWFSL